MSENAEQSSGEVPVVDVQSNRSRLSSKLHMTRRRWIVVIILLALVIAGAGAWLYLRDDAPGYVRVKDDGLTGTQRLVRDAQKEELPEDASEEVTYYTRLAAAYASDKQYQQALDTMLKADSLITDHSVGNGRSVNIAIAGYYEHLNDKSKALEYYKRELARAKTVSDNEDAIKAIQAQIDRLSK